MTGQRFDYSTERQRHESFVGRADLLARLDQLLVDGDGDRWVVITGGPGMGKSAILAAWLARREAAGVMVPHHFIAAASMTGMTQASGSARWWRRSPPGFLICHSQSRTCAWIRRRGWMPRCAASRSMRWSRAGAPGRQYASI